MDPNATLREILLLCGRLQEQLQKTEVDDLAMLNNIAIEAGDLAILLLGLDRWLRKGGFLPAAWRRAISKKGSHEDQSTAGG